MDGMDSHSALGVLIQTEKPYNRRIPCIGADLASAQTGLVFMLAWMGLAVCLLDTTWRNGGELPRHTGCRLDPNQAPWWELTVLPGIGPELARRIVEFRNGPQATISQKLGRPLFQEASDLDPVLGLGPKRIAGLAPYLRFPQNRALPKPPASMNQYRNTQDQQK